MNFRYDLLQIIVADIPTLHMNNADTSEQSHQIVNNTILRCVYLVNCKSETCLQVKAQLSS